MGCGLYRTPSRLPLRWAPTGGADGSESIGTAVQGPDRTSAGAGARGAAGLSQPGDAAGGAGLCGDRRGAAGCRGPAGRHRGRAVGDRARFRPVAADGAGAAGLLRGDGGARAVATLRRAVRLSAGAGRSARVGSRNRASASGRGRAAAGGGGDRQRAQRRCGQHAAAARRARPPSLSGDRPAADAPVGRRRTVGGDRARVRPFPRRSRPFLGVDLSRPHQLVPHGRGDGGRRRVDVAAVPEVLRLVRAVFQRLQFRDGARGRVRGRRGERACRR